RNVTGVQTCALPIYQVLASHVYAQAGAYLLTVQVDSLAGTSGTGFATALVDDVALEASASEELHTGVTPASQPGLNNVVLASFRDRKSTRLNSSHVS